LHIEENNMIARYFLVVVILLGIVTACVPPADSGLKKTAEQLKAGMTKEQVAPLFHDFEAGEAK